MQDYLTESKLGEILNKVMPTGTWEHNKVVPNSRIKTRPDYRNDKLKLIVEFDGWKHYTVSQQIVRDNFKDITYIGMGYEVIRIPYFVQLETRTIKHYFNIDYELEQDFPHGFIVDDKLVLPADYCTLGIHRFQGQMLYLPKSVRKEIYQSLKDKLENKFDNNIELVFPSETPLPSIYYDYMGTLGL